MNCSKFPASDCGSRSGRRCTTEDGENGEVCVPNPRYSGGENESEYSGSYGGASGNSQGETFASSDLNTAFQSFLHQLNTFLSCAFVGGVLNCSKFPASECGHRSQRRCTTDDSGACVPNPRFVGAIDEFGK